LHRCSSIPVCNSWTCSTGDTASERRAVEEATGTRLAHLDDVDTFNDLEELLAIPGGMRSGDHDE